MKFSDVPRFLIQDFFDVTYPDDTSIGSKPYLMGQDRGIVAHRNTIFNLVIFDNDEWGKAQNWYSIPFTKYGDYTDEWFYLERVTSYETSATSGFSIDYGDDAYFVKNSSFYEYLDARQVDYESGIYDHNISNMVNKEKIFLYFGPIYSTNTENVFKVRYRGMDDYVTSCLPEHNCTDNIKELFKVFFDEVYNEVYNQQKNIFSLLDPREINKNHLNYISGIYNMETDIDIPEVIRRNITANHINYLKRVGTYSSLFVTYKNVLFDTYDNLNVYERWHDRYLSPTTPPLPHFVDFNYLHYYSVCPSSCADPGYTDCSSISLGGWSVPADGCYLHMQYVLNNKWIIFHNLKTNKPLVQCFNMNDYLLTPKEVTNEVLSYKDVDNEIVTYYRTIITFNSASRGYAFLITPNNYTYTEDYEWEITHDLDQVTPIIKTVKEELDSSKTVELYPDPTDRYIQSFISPTKVESLSDSTALIECYCPSKPLSGSYIVDAITLASSGSYIHEQEIAAKTWSIEHNLDGVCAVNFYTATKSKTWYIFHNLNTEDLIVQCFDNNYEMIYPYTTTIINSNVIKIDFERAVRGRAYITIADYSIQADTIAREIDLQWSERIYVTKEGEVTSGLFRCFTEVGDGIVLGGGTFLYDIPFIARSEDYGVTWSLVDTTLDDVEEICSIEYLENGIVLAGGGSTNKLFRSEDYGVTWTDLGNITVDSRITSIEYLENGIVLAGVYNDGHIYRSVDYGLTWTDLGKIDASDLKDILYIGNGVCFASNFRIYKSTDYGASFSEVYNGFPSDLNPLIYIAENVLLFEKSGSLVITTDGGTSWDYYGSRSDIYEIAETYNCSIDKSTARVIFRQTGLNGYGKAILYGEYDYDEIYFLSDGTLLHADEEGYRRSYSIYKSNNLFSSYNLPYATISHNLSAYGGYIISNCYEDNVLIKQSDEITKGEYSCNVYTTEPTTITFNCSLPEYIEYLYNVESATVEHNLNSKNVLVDTYRPITNDIIRVNPGDNKGNLIIQCYDENNNKVEYEKAYYDVDGNLCLEFDSKVNIRVNSVTATSTVPCSSMSYTDFCGFPPDIDDWPDNLIYFENGILVMTIGNDATRSTDYGATWTSIGKIDIGDYVYCWTYLGSGEALIAGGTNYPYRIKIGYTGDYGETWSIIASGAPFDAENIWPYDNLLNLGGGVILLGSYGHIYKSEDSGYNWSEVYEFYVECMCDMGGGKVLAASDGLVIKSDDYGENWAEVANVNSYQCILGYFGSGVVVLEDTYTIWRSSDYGETWEIVHEKEDTGCYPSHFINLGNGEGIMVTDFYSGIRYSNDYGLTWQYINDDAFIGGYINSKYNSLYEVFMSKSISVNDKVIILGGEGYDIDTGLDYPKVLLNYPLKLKNHSLECINPFNFISQPVSITWNFDRFSRYDDRDIYFWNYSAEYYFWDFEDPDSVIDSDFLQYSMNNIDIEYRLIDRDSFTVNSYCNCDINFALANAKYLQEDLEDVWYIEHYLETYNLVVNVYTAMISGSSYETYYDDYRLIQCYDNNKENIDLLDTTISVYSSTPHESPNKICSVTTGKTSSFCCTRESANIDTEKTGTTWNINHGLGTMGIVSQYFDNNGTLVVPDSITIIDNNSFSATFSSSTSGYCLYEQVDYQEYVGSGESLIEHNLNSQGIIVQIFDSSFNSINMESGYVTIVDSNNCSVDLPSGDSYYVYIILASPVYRNITSDVDIKLLSKDIIKVTSSEDVFGYTTIRIADDVFMQAEKFIPKNITMIDDDNISLEFYEETSPVVVITETDFIGRGLRKTYPKTHLTVNNNTCTANFSESVDGYACLKRIGSLPYHGNLMMSPHYKVELDLSCEPLSVALQEKGITENNFIINKATADELVDQWEQTRPACKYPHYHWLVALPSDFSKEYINLYDIDEKCNIYTKCCVETLTITTSAHYVYDNYVASSTWEITHNLDCNGILAQFYKDNEDGTFSIVYPYKIEILSNNVIKVHFSESFIGIGLVTRPLFEFTDFNSTTAESSATWRIIHDLGEESLTDYFDIYEKQFSPYSVEIVDNDNITATFFVQSLGNTYATDNDYVHTQSSATSKWYINHNLGYQGVIVQAFDNDNLFIPNNIILVDENKCRLEFNTSVSGYAIVKAVGSCLTAPGLYRKSSVIKIGTGTSGKNWHGNNLQNAVAESCTDLVKSTDGTYYYIDGDILLDRNNRYIKEIGLFDNTGKMLFYSYVKGTLYKPEKVEFSVHYRLEIP